jgi:nitronate monooxygenase
MIAPLDFSPLLLPLIAAPMTAVSTPELVGAACAAGVVGSFPTANARTASELDEWLERIAAQTTSRSTSVTPGPVAANLIVHRSNERLAEDLACIGAWGVDIVITSVGNPLPVLDDLHSAGCRVLADVASLAHAEKALAGGVDGLVLLSAGAGGNTGWANPFAFARAVRRFYGGPLVLAGGISDGRSLWSAITLGYDLGYMGTKFIATPESGASPEWKAAVVSSSLDDIVLGVSPYGISASLLGSVGSAGHTVSGVTAELDAREVIEATTAEWHEARATTLAALSEG